MAEILFTHSYFLRYDPKEFRAMTPYPPLGTLYAASAARTRGYTVALFDSMLAQEERGVAEAIRQHRPHIVVIYDDDFNYLTKMCLTRMRRAAFRISEIARAAGCTVIVHGSDPGDHMEEYLTHNADYVIFGEGEETLLDTLDFLRRGVGERSSIAGLAYFHDGVVHHGKDRPVLRDLNKLAFPAWDLVDMNLYRTTWKRRHGYFSLNMVTTRGCPFHCNWCAKPLYGQGYSSRSPEDVVTEMLHLKEHYAPDRLWFCDDVFGLSPGWIPAFAEEVQQRHVSIPFKCQARVDLLLKGDTIGQLRKSGCTTVWVGAESGSQMILDAMEKGTTVEQISEATQRLKRAGIRVGFFLQFGYPGEGVEEIEKTLAMVRGLLPDEIGVSVSYPLPGTPFYERVKGELGEKRNWEVSEDLEVMFRGTFEPDFYRLLHTFTHKKLRIWQGQDLLSRLRSRPWTMRPAHARPLAAYTFHSFTVRRLESEIARHAATHEKGDPFSMAAATYDAAFSSLTAVKTIRARVYDLVTHYVRPGGRILEIGCGTGVDAVWLAEHGYAVVATDPSAAMLEIARGKAPPDLSSLVAFQELSADRLNLVSPACFNAIFSNFGALNCIQDIRSLFRQCKTLLAPGGVLVLCLMNPYVLWESLAFLSTLQVRKAFRRKTSTPVNVPVGAGVVQTWYHPPRRIIAWASPDFVREAVVGINIFSPPPSSQRFRGAHPRLVSLLERLDRALDDIVPFSHLGDHVVIVLRLRPAGES